MRRVSLLWFALAACGGEDDGVAIDPWPIPITGGLDASVDAQVPDAAREDGAAARDAASR